MELEFRQESDDGNCWGVRRDGQLLAIIYKKEEKISFDLPRTLTLEQMRAITEKMKEPVEEKIS